MFQNKKSPLLLLLINSVSFLSVNLVLSQTVGTFFVFFMGCLPWTNVLGRDDFDRSAQEISEQGRSRGRGGISAYKKLGPAAPPIEAGKTNAETTTGIKYLDDKADPQMLAAKI